MRKFVFLFCLIVTCFHSYAQSRYYLGKNNEITTDSVNATSYILVEKEDKGEPIWKMRQYSLDDSLVLVGSFKDNRLKIPHGKFIIYNVKEARRIIKYDPALHKLDTSITSPKIYIGKTGTFVDGEKEGEWIDYFEDGSIEFTFTYKSGKLDGISRSYNYDTKKLLFEGNYINNLKEGVWTNFAYTGAILQEDIYKNNQIRKSISHAEDKQFKRKITGGSPDYDFKAYLNEVLQEINFGQVKGKLMLSFTLNKEGKLLNESFYGPNGFTDKMLLKILDAVTDAPAWKPNYVNGILSEVYIPISISIPDKEIQIGFRGPAKQIYQSTFKAMSPGL
jgi:antitoxin component YwqK of YwqJK toxin-antitoxin module